MRAIQYDDFGPSSVLKLVELKTPKPGEGEVLVKVKAAGVNPVDVKIREGLLVSRVPCIFPIIPGWDFSGEIVDHGFAAHRFDIGEKVIGYCRRPTIQHGTYADYITLPEAYITKAPKNIPLRNAAALPLAGLTAYQSLFTHGRLKKNETVVIWGASGGVGSFAVQLAAKKEAKVIAIASKKNTEYTKKLGASYAIDYTSQNVEEEIRKLSPEGVDLVFDTIGGETFKRCFNIVKRSGRIVSILENIKEASQLPKPEIEYHYCFVEPNSSNLNVLREMVDNGDLKIHVEMEYPLEEAAKAQEMVEKGHTKGKIIITMD
jgi:NADPH:quinone reductase and related Zn-dependent oxidoreductases